MPMPVISQFRRHRPDVTLMDLRLPGTNGTDVLISIRGEFP
jgi:CheY-like chemotaxis protein